MNSLKSLVNGLKVGMGEKGIVEGKEVKLIMELEKLLSGREDYEVEKVKEGSGKVRRFGYEEIEGMVKLKKMGVSNEKIGSRFGCVGMMVSNVFKRNVYRDISEMLIKEGKWL